MIALIERTRISVPAECAWQLFRELDSRYGDLHPEHLRWRTLRGDPLRRHVREEGESVARMLGADSEGP